MLELGLYFVAAVIFIIFVVWVLVASFVLATMKQIHDEENRQCRKINKYWDDLTDKLAPKEEK